MSELAATRAVGAVLRRVDISIQSEMIEGWPLASSRASATATLSVTSGPFTGYGGGWDPESAGVLAAMECIERHAQFRDDLPPPDVVAPWQVVHEVALSPPECGLYHAAQYTSPGFPCAPFDAKQPVEWITVIDVLSRKRVLAPIEFIYPNAPLPRKPLVRESSSGSAAHVNEDSATLAAVCELIERDGLMLFWHRQPRTVTLGVDEVPNESLREELDRVRTLGYVVLIASLSYDLGVPCFLVIALHGTCFAFGLGCHPAPEQALAHATNELGRRLAWLHSGGSSERVHRGLAAVHAADDHYYLYHDGPWHQVLRNVLNHTLLTVVSETVLTTFQRHPLDDSRALATLYCSLADRGLRAYTCDITPPNICDTGIRVVRALIPGLIPVHFGFDRLRLGCARLSATSVPGRLCNLLPHFLN